MIHLESEQTMTNTNDWHITQDADGYLDIERELISFPDDGNSSVDLRLTFDRAAHSAYLVLMRRNDDGDTRDLLPKEIPMEWGAAIAYLGDAAALLPLDVSGAERPVISTLNLNVFDGDGGVIGTKVVDMTREQIEDVVSHAVQLTQIRRQARRSSDDAEAVLDELEEALDSCGALDQSAQDAPAASL